MALKVPSGVYQPTSGSFPGVLMRGWTYGSVRELIYNLSDVLMCLPFTEGPVNSRCSMSFWGSGSRSQQMINRSIYSEIQGDPKQKSAIEAYWMI